MTACTEHQGAPLGKKAVSAAVAGALAAGMVPAVALAAPAGEQPGAGDGISALNMSGAYDFSQGSVTNLTIAGQSVSVVDGKATMTVVNNGGAPASLIKVNQVTTGEGTVLNNTNAGLWTVAASTTGSATDFTTPGTWTVTVKATDPNYAPDGGNYGTITFTLEVEGRSLAGATAYEENPLNTGDTTDTTFDYTASGLNIKFALDGNPLTVGTAKTNAIKTVTWYKGTGPDATAVTGAAADGTYQPTNAGTYTVVLEGNDAAGYEGKVSVPVVVNKLDLATANIVIPEQTSRAAFTIDTVTINGISLANDASGQPSPLAAQLSMELVKTNTNIPGEQPNGEYVFKISAPQVKDTVNGVDVLVDNPNIINSQEVSTYKVTSTAVTWFYAGSKLTGTSNTLGTIDTSYNGTLFNANYLYVGPTADIVNDNGGANDYITAADRLAYTYQVIDTKTGEKVSNDSVSKPGSWTVVARVDAAAAKNNYEFGGSQTITMTVVNGVIQSNDVIVKQNGEVVSTPTFTYDGTDVLDKVDITVKCGDKTLTKGTDYTLKAQSNGADVDGAINAGTYTVSVIAPNYQVTAPTFQVKVDPVKVLHLRVANQIIDPVTEASFLPYTGQPIPLAIEFSSQTKLDPNATDWTYTTLPAEVYTAGIQGPNNATELQAKGNYSITVSQSNSAVAQNYDFSAITAPVTVTVADGKSNFRDVTSSDWFYVPVNEAYDNEYMNGYGNSKIFGPYDKLTRGQAACVLYNMAGGSIADDYDYGYTEEQGWKTGFSDVDGKMYYAKAIAWAKQAGVVHGYAGTDKFGPNDNVTREEFAAMLANYAKAINDFTAVEDVDATLATKADGAKVSDWAKESVAWAVAEKIMGNNGTIAPLQTIPRCEVAAMAVNYQPEPLDPKPVAAAVTELYVYPGTLDLTAGDTSKPSVTVIGKGDFSTAWTVASDDGAVATVAADGTITAVAAGVATITYTSTETPSVKATVTVTVTAA